MDKWGVRFWIRSNGAFLGLLTSGEAPWANLWGGHFGDWGHYIYFWAREGRINKSGDIAELKQKIFSFVD